MEFLFHDSDNFTKKCDDAKNQITQTRESPVNRTLSLVPDEQFVQNTQKKTLFLTLVYFWYLPLISTTGC